MSKEDQTELKQVAQDFVRTVITEVFGQQVKQTTVRKTARRLIEGLPASKESTPAT